MASEIRVNKIENRSGLGTVTFADTGVDLAGIVTATTFSGSGASLTGLPAAQLSGTLPAISGANLTNLAAANLTGTIADARFPATLPAASAANLTNIPAANVTGTLPAISAANLTQIPAANIVGVCTAGLASASGVLAGVTMVDSWRITTNFSFDSSGYDVTSNWERSNETAHFGVLGSAMTESSGIFTFPQTGIYLISWNVTHRYTAERRYVGAGIVGSTNNFSSSEYISRSYDSIVDDSNYGYSNVGTEVIFDCVDTSQYKVRMQVMAPATTQIYADSTEDRTSVTFIRLGDT